MQESHDDAIGIEHHDLARGDVVDLPHHFGEVGGRVAQLLCEDDDLPRRIAPLTVVADEPEVDRLVIALSADAHDAPLLRQQRAERIERPQDDGCYADGDLAHFCSQCCRIPLVLYD